MVSSQTSEIAAEVILPELRHRVLGYRPGLDEKSERQFGEQPEEVEMCYAMQWNSLPHYLAGANRLVNQEICKTSER